VFLVVNFVAGLGWAIGLAAGVVVLYVALWYLLPLFVHRGAATDTKV
jgi:hypothetical protein